jgi:hypothetical protein
MQYRFDADEGRFYVSDKVGGILMEQFKTLGVKPGEAVDITRAETGHGPERRTRWMVAKSVTVSEQTDGTLAVPAEPPTSELEQKLSASIRLVEARKRAEALKAHAAEVQARKQESGAAPAWANFLVEQSNALVDAYAQVLQHSTRHEGLVKTDDVRSIFLSAFINVTKGGNRNAA